MHRPWLVLGLCAAGLTGIPALAQTQDDLFDPNVLHELRFEMNPADWSRLRALYTTDNYYNCNLRWRNLTVENIGIRSRGLGSRSGDKPGLRVDFDRFELNQEFLGLKSFVLDNLVQDASMLKERLAMLFFQRLGQPAPREAHCRMYVNDQYWGVYAIVESIDKKFLARNLRESEGYLYEYRWTEDYYFEYRGADLSRYSPIPYKPETHENNPDPRPLEALTRVVNQAPDGDFLRAAGEYLDLPNSIQHVALENFLAEWDGILGAFGMNNFYLYRFERRNLHRFLVWDKDNTFGGQLKTDPERIEYPLLQGVSRNVLARRAMAVPELRTLYLETLYRAAQSAGGSGGWLEQEIDRQYNRIRDSAYEDPYKRCPDPSSGIHRPCSNEEFEADIAFLRRFARGRAPYVLREVANEGYVAAEAPRLAEGGAVNAATFGATLAPGSLISLFGERLATGTAAASSLPLPTELARTSVTVNGVQAPLLFVSPSQVNLQIPWEIQPGTVDISAAVGAAVGNTIRAAVGAHAPGVFAVVHAADGAPVSGTRPASSGSVLVIYANGLGPVQPATTTGQAAPADPLSRTQTAPTVTVGGVPAEIIFSGLTPGFVGLYQMNVRLGTNVPAGSETPLVVTAGGIAGPPVRMATR
jgi:uncharacterized protein (TIGR03437 family)